MADDAAGHVAPEDAAEQLLAEQAAAAKPRRDKAPKRRKEPSGAEKARKRAAREAAEGRGSSASSPPSSARAIKDLENGLAQTLTFPALPVMMLPLPIDTQLFMVQHFTTAGPATAKQLATAAQQSPELRELLERANKGSATLTLLVAGLIYVAPVILWSLGKREAATLGSQMAAMDPEAMQAQAAEIEAQMAAMAAMFPEDGQPAEQPGAPGAEQPGAPGAEAATEPPTAG